MRCMAASLSLVGIRSCIVLYQDDFITSVAVEACSIFHTCFQSVRGDFLTILISLGGVSFIANLSKTWYILRLRWERVSSGVRGTTYAMSSTRWRRCISLVGIRGA